MTGAPHRHPSPVNSSSSSHFNCPVRSAVEPLGSLCAHLQSNRQRCRKRRCAWSSSAGKSLRSCIQGPPRASRHRWGKPLGVYLEHDGRCSVQPGRPGRSSGSCSTGRWRCSDSALSWWWLADSGLKSSLPPQCIPGILYRTRCGFSSEKGQPVFHILCKMPLMTE